MFVLFKTENKEGIDKFIEFLIKHQSDPIYKGECVENLFINNKLTRIQWDKEVTTCYDRTNIEECGGIELRYENPFEKYW